MTNQKNECSVPFSFVCFFFLSPKTGTLRSLQRAPAPAKGGDRQAPAGAPEHAGFQSEDDLFFSQKNVRASTASCFFSSHPPSLSTTPLPNQTERNGEEGAVDQGGQGERKNRRIYRKREAGAAAAAAAAGARSIAVNGNAASIFARRRLCRRRRRRRRSSSFFAASTYS